MCGLKSLVRLMLGKNPVYCNVKHGEEESYQSYFMEIINSVDVENLTDEAHCRPFAHEAASRDLNSMHQIANKARFASNLSPLIIELMVMQYIYADPLLRKKDKRRWIYNVMSRGDKAYFPDAISMYSTMYNT